MPGLWDVQLSRGYDQQYPSITVTLLGLKPYPGTHKQLTDEEERNRFNSWMAHDDHMGAERSQTVVFSEGESDAQQLRTIQRVIRELKGYEQ